MLKDLKALEKAPRANINLFDDNFTLSELNKAMKKLKTRKSPGPDKIHNEMLTHLGHNAKKIILDFINNTWQKGEVPRLWKLVIVKPLLKKGKPAEKFQATAPYLSHHVLENLRNA